MDHLSDIAKIIEGGLKFNAQMVVSYSESLIRKLEAEGQAQAARLLRRKLDGAEATLKAYGQSPARLPSDQESQLSLANEEWVDHATSRAVLEPTIRREVEQFLTYVRASDRLAEAGVGISPQMLIHGPPGVGKTQLARHIAAELKLPLLTARCDSLISSYLGSTSKNIRRLFDHAASRPCVLFLDEFDALAKARDDRQELGELKRVAVSLLQNLDALPRQTVVIAATNHPQLLDPAVWRRFAYNISLDLPSAPVRRALLQLNLADYGANLGLDHAINASQGLSGASLRQAAEEAIRRAIVEGREAVEITDLLARIAQIALAVKGLTAEPQAIAQHLVQAGVPLRLASQASYLSMRQIARISKDLRSIGVHEESLDGRTEEPHHRRQSSPARAATKARRRRRP